MKRIQLFEFEDLEWFPDVLRICMTRLIAVMHRLINTADELAGLLDQTLREAKTAKIVDLCSGNGEVMLDTFRILQNEYAYADLQLTLTDLYPNQASAQEINRKETQIRYHTSPVDAAAVSDELTGLKTMVSAFHHMNPVKARKILERAEKSGEPICIFEISDNSFPLFLWWLPLPVNFLMCLIITPMVRPLTWQQLLFTYLIPVLPLCFAWDGAVSNARTYTSRDLDVLLSGLGKGGYEWRKGIFHGKSKKIWLVGIKVRN